MCGGSTRQERKWRYSKGTVKRVIEINEDFHMPQLAVRTLLGLRAQYPVKNPIQMAFFYTRDSKSRFLFGSDIFAGSPENNFPSLSILDIQDELNRDSSTPSFAALRWSQTPSKTSRHHLHPHITVSRHSKYCKRKRPDK